MAGGRDAVRMTDAEATDFLAGNLKVQVATVGKDGAPHLTTLWFAVHQGLWLFETYGKSQKVVNMRRDPRVAVLAEQGTSYAELRGVSVQGRAEIVDAGDELLRLMEVIVARNHRALDEAEVAKIAAAMAQKRVVVRVRPDKVISWDHRKLAP